MLIPLTDTKTETKKLRKTETKRKRKKLMKNETETEKNFATSITLVHSTCFGRRRAKTTYNLVTISLLH